LLATDLVESELDCASHGTGKKIIHIIRLKRLADFFTPPTPVAVATAFED
jgi:hypothetical protein